MVAKKAKNAGMNISSLGKAVEFICKSLLAETEVMEIGIIESYDPETNTATVKVATKQKLSYSNPQGGMMEEYIDSPILPKVPVVFPQGGGMILTFPITQGDECILHYANRPFWGWFQKGGVQNRSHSRMHHYQDAVVFVGVNSKPNTIQNIAVEGAELRNIDATIKLNVSDNGIAATGDLSVEGDITVTGNITSDSDIQAVNITATGDLTTDGELSVGSDATISGELTASDAVLGGIRFSTHTHNTTAAPANGPTTPPI